MFRSLLKLFFPLLVLPSFLIVMALAVGIVLLAVDLVWSREHRLAWALIELIVSQWRIALVIAVASALWLATTIRVAIGLFSPDDPETAPVEIAPADARAEETALSASRS